MLQLPEDFWNRRLPDLRESLRAWFELTGAWSLAIAWPVYQRLESGTEALTFYSIRGIDLAIFIAVVSLAVPTVLLLLETLLARAASFTASRFLHAGLTGILLGLVVWQALQGRPALAALALLAVFAVITVYYLRLAFVRTFALLLAIATPITILLFALSYPVRFEVLPGEKSQAAQKTDSVTPVVMVVMDELPLALLLNEKGEIDRKLLPNLARIADETIWYPRAAAAGDETLTALPSIMTGEDPDSSEQRDPPGLPSYPDNLCTITERAGFNINAEEVVTDFCSRKGNLPLRISEMIRLGVFPKAAPFESAETEVDTSSDGEELSPGRLIEDAALGLANLHPAPPPVWGSDRTEHMREFTASVDLDPKSFNFLHIILPHAPFQFTEDGYGYASFLLDDRATGNALELPENDGETKKSMQQALAQTIYTLSLVEAIIQKMKQAGAWDESLFVLTADHGASFKLGHRRRTLDTDNAGWLIPVPLFIKYPGQSKGSIDRRIVASNDIAPTVFDALGLEPGPNATGSSLLGKPSAEQPSELSLTSQETGELTISTEEISRQEKEALQLRNEAFGSGSLYAIGGEEQLLGGQAGRSDLEPLDATLQTGGPVIEADPDGFFIPAYVQALLPEIDSDPGVIAVAVNGKFAATTRAWQRDGVWMTGTNLPIDAFRKGSNRIELFSAPGPG